MLNSLCSDQRYKLVQNDLCAFIQKRAKLELVSGATIKKYIIWCGQWSHMYSEYENDFLGAEKE